jgi:hypothetical protein
MNATMRLMTIGFFMGFLAVGVFSLRFACTPRDFREEIRVAKLAEMEQEVLIRWEARDQVLRDLIGKRCTLAEAIERFLKLDPPWPYVEPKVPAGTSPQDRSYQHIRFMIEGKLRDHPEQASIVLHRLEREYEKLRAERQSRSTSHTEPVESRSLNKK